MAIGSLFDEDGASGAASSAPAAAAVSDASSDALSFWDSGEAAVVAMPFRLLALIDVIKADQHKLCGCPTAAAVL